MGMQVRVGAVLGRRRNNFYRDRDGTLELVPYGRTEIWGKRWMPFSVNTYTDALGISEEEAAKQCDDLYGETYMGEGEGDVGQAQQT